MRLRDDPACRGVLVSDWTLHLGDCLDPVTGLASLADRSVDHVITDPPYDEHTHSCDRRGHTGYAEGASSRGATFSRTRDLGFSALTADQMTALGAQFGRVTRRWVHVFCALEMIADWRRALERGGLQYIRTCVWHKIGSTPQFTGDRPATAVEAIVVAHPKGRKKWNAGGKHGIYAHPIVLNRGGVETRVHTTQKPVELMRDLVADFTNADETICDPFAGSGTTGLACRILGRRFIGWELNADYHAIATRRIAGDEAKPRAEQPSLWGRT
jgi:DNA modification methylase